MTDVGGDQDLPLALAFDPELVSIAGFYATRDGLGSAPIGKPVQVRLRGEALSFDRLG